MRTSIFLFLMLASLGYGQISNNLLLHYAFDGTTNDNSVNANNGTAFGGVTYGADRFGNPNSAAYFDGINDYVEFPNSNQLKPNLPVSFSFWIKYTSSSYQNQVVFNTSFEENRSAGVWFNSSSSTNSYAVNFGDGTYDFTSDTRRTFVTNSSIVTNVWHHVVVIVNGQFNMKIYVDCQDVTGTYSGAGGSLVYSDNPGCIGRHDRNLSLPTDYFKGYIDDFRYWNRTLTLTEVNELCSALSTAENEVAKTKFVVYPNPASGVLNIETSLESIQSISLYNTIGDEVYKSDFKTAIDVSSLSPGIYFVKANTGSDFITTKVIIK